MSVEYRRVNARTRCPLCNSGKGCAFGRDENGAEFLKCKHVAEGAYYSHDEGLGLYHYHRLDGSAQTTRAAFESERRKDVAKADAAELNRVYSEFLEHSPLSPADADHLTKVRKLSIETITANCYGSALDRVTLEEVCTDLAARFDLSLIPGFRRNRGNRWTAECYAGELLIPVRDEKRRIVAMQRRGRAGYRWFSCPQAGTPSSGTPMHFASPHLVDVKPMAILSEGPLKIDIVSERLHVAGVAVPGVACVPETIGLRLRDALPALRTLIVAFDADYRTNENVRASLRRLLSRLQSSDLEVLVMTWTDADAKGVDDLLLREAR